MWYLILTTYTEKLMLKDIILTLLVLAALGSFLVVLAEMVRDNGRK
jgi:hypothetical protein